MTKIEPIELESLDGFGRGLRAAFVWSGDGFHATIYVVAPGSIAPLLALDAATPIQEIVRHTTPDGRTTLLLTGAGAGRYWSGAIVATADERGARLSFDLACRCKDDAPTPSVSYRVGDGVAATCHRLGAELAIAHGPQIRIETDSSVLLADGELRIESTKPSHLSARETIQLRYDITTKAG